MYFLFTRDNSGGLCGLPWQEISALGKAEVLLGAFYLTSS